ncbi:putative anti-sigma factor [Pedobacter sp. BAL39]|uniref:FecR family protein n=1 Tax=Pedobacter sp. BAL39 TaxID=391596 RepID=UPI0001559809|nr:FecR domain-containing protein [Pedobacter sp. BAL39]EDM36933.1 putative anti-sigma factor [Pedobacter sp. BAL39]
MDNRINILFRRYQDGTATAEERRLVEAWYESHQGQEVQKLSLDEASAVFADLDARIAMMTEEGPKRRRLNFRWLQAAAVFLVLLGTGLVIKVRNKPKVELPESYTEIRSLNGVKKEVTLQDGTTVFLNSGSSVFISSKFGKTKREVKLVGEAFFNVQHDKSRPFIIYSGKIQTTVLGTSFDVKAYADDEQVKVTVAAGKVNVQQKVTSDKGAAFSKLLLPNQALVYNKTRESHLVKAANADSISAWRTNHLNFDNASYPEIVRMLGRWYDLDITMDAAYDPKKYTLSFHNERADKVLNVLSALTGTTYHMNGRKVIITSIK